MTRVAILPEREADGSPGYRAIGGDKHSTGRTPGEALDRLTEQLPDEERGTMVIVQSHQPDRFFTAAQQTRLAELMESWRSARDTGRSLSGKDQSELDALVQSELQATILRARALLGEQAH